MTPPASRSALDPACPQDDWPFTDGTALLVNHGGPAHRRQTTEHMKRRLAQTCWGVDASPADLPGRPANDGREAQKPTTGAAVLRPYKAAASYVRRLITSQHVVLVVWAPHRLILPVHYLQPASLIGLAPPMGFLRALLSAKLVFVHVGSIDVDFDVDPIQYALQYIVGPRKPEAWGLTDK